MEFRKRSSVGCLSSTNAPLTRFSLGYNNLQIGFVQKSCSYESALYVNSEQAQYSNRFMDLDGCGLSYIRMDFGWTSRIHNMYIIYKRLIPFSPPLHHVSVYILIYNMYFHPSHTLLKRFSKFSSIHPLPLPT